LSATANNLRANAEALRGLSATAVFRDDMDKAREYFRKMIEIDPKVNVILASGFRQDERVQEVMQLGVKSFIHKPYTMEKLTQAVNEAL